jgi:hypothetical protein
VALRVRTTAQAGAAARSFRDRRRRRGGLGDRPGLRPPLHGPRLFQKVQGVYQALAAADWQNHPTGSLTGCSAALNGLVLEPQPGYGAATE